MVCIVNFFYVLGKYNKILLQNCWNLTIANDFSKNTTDIRLCHKNPFKIKF